MTNTGQMKLAGVSVVSRIMRREKASRRMRRMRVRGKLPSASSCIFWYWQLAGACYT
jgi:hypothetical protein